MEKIKKRRGPKKKFESGDQVRWTCAFGSLLTGTYLDAYGELSAVIVPGGHRRWVRTEVLSKMKDR